MTHAVITVIICICAGVASAPAWTCLLPALWYMGREFAQAEYRYIDDFCDGKRANMPWYGGFLPSAWTVKGMMDWLLPAVVSTGAWLCLS